MGTPEFAVASLEALIDAGKNIVGVVTVPDKPAGRGKKLRMSAVKKSALSHDIPILQPEVLKAEDFLLELSKWEANLFIVVAFRMLPKVVWSMPKFGTFNLHASLLPQYRGAAPINRAIMNGEKESGVTTFFIDQKIDTGEILLQKKVEILPQEQAGELHDKLMNIGAEVVVETVNGIFTKNITPISQKQIPQHEELRTANKIFREDCQIDWAQTSSDINNLIRGLTPYPCAFTYLQNNNTTKQVKIFRAEKTDEKTNLKPGTIVSDGKKFLKVATGDCFIFIKELQIEGKRAMSAISYLSGNNLEKSSLFVKK